MHCRFAFFPEPLLRILFQINRRAPVGALSIVPCLSRFKKFRPVFLRFETFPPRKENYFLCKFSQKGNQEKHGGGTHALAL